MKRWRRTAATCAAAVIATATATAVLSQPASAAWDRTPPTAPSGLRVTGVTENSVSFAWNASTDNSGSVRYLIEMAGRGFTFGPYTGTSGTLLDRTLLPPNTTHTFRVLAYDAAFNYSPRSNAVVATTLPDIQAPTTPTGLQMVSSTPHTVALRWNPSTDNVGWPSDVTYRVSLGSTVVGRSSSLNGAPARFEMRHLPRGAVLTFAVHAVDRSGNASAPATITVDLPDSADTTPPIAPVLVSGVDAEYSTAKLTWIGSTDDTTAPGDIEYEFLVDGQLLLFNPGEFVYPVVRGATTGWVTVVNGPGTFTFAVRAVDRAGNISDPSNPVTVTVTAGY